MADQQKCCTCCKEYKDLEHFGPNKGTKDGMHYVCKPCKKMRDAETRERRREKLKTIDWKSQIKWEGTKTCSKCGKEKNRTEFGKSIQSTDFLVNECKSCRKELGRERRQSLSKYTRKRKADMGNCADCGLDTPNLLQFDHVRGVKLKMVTALHSEKKIDEEIAKTEMRCIMCHRYKSAKEAAERRVINSHTPYFCVTERNRQFVKETKAKIGACVQCECKIRTEDGHHFACFDFDHLDPQTKTASVSKMASGTYSVQRIQEEIDKCQLLCAACHWLKSGKQLGFTGYE